MIRLIEIYSANICLRLVFTLTKFIKGTNCFTISLHLLVVNLLSIKLQIHNKQRNLYQVPIGMESGYKLMKITCRFSSLYVKDATPKTNCV